jgi:cytidyltransferase-like protein
MIKRIWRENEAYELANYIKENFPNKIIAFCSGYFHPTFHRGHLALINESKKLCDILIIIINGSNATIRKYGFELIPIEERLAIAAEFRNVDFVIDFDRTNMVEPLRIFNVDIFTRGGDVTEDIFNKSERLQCELSNTQVVFNVGGGKIASSSEFLSRAKYYNERNTK